MALHSPRNWHDERHDVGGGQSDGLKSGWSWRVWANFHCFRSDFRPRPPRGWPSLRVPLQGHGQLLPPRSRVPPLRCPYHPATDYLRVSSNTETYQQWDQYIWHQFFSAFSWRTIGWSSWDIETTTSCKPWLFIQRLKTKEYHGANFIRY